MGDIVFNIAKGKIAYYAGLPASADALIIVPIEATGIVSDATMKDYATLSAVLAGASNEQTDMGRKTLTGVTVTVDNSGDLVKIDADDPSWTATTGNAVAALIVCYDPDTGSGDDTTLVPLFKYDFAHTPAGGDVTAVIGGSGLGQAA